MKKKCYNFFYNYYAIFIFFNFIYFFCVPLILLMPCRFADFEIFLYKMFSYLKLQLLHKIKFQFNNKNVHMRTELFD